jgi:hypothetical protein
MLLMEDLVNDLKDGGKVAIQWPKDTYLSQHC